MQRVQDETLLFLVVKVFLGALICGSNKAWTMPKLVSIRDAIEIFQQASLTFSDASPLHGMKYFCHVGLDRCQVNNIKSNLVLSTELTM